MTELRVTVQDKSAHDTVAVVTIGFVSTFLNRRILNKEYRMSK